MNTSFTLTINKDKENEQGFTINLGCDVLEGMTQADKDKFCESAKKIRIQQPLRKLDSLSAIRLHLRKTYPDAEITEGIERPETATSKLRELEVKQKELEELAGGPEAVQDIINQLKINRANKALNEGNAEADPEPDLEAEVAG